MYLICVLAEIKQSEMRLQVLKVKWQNGELMGGGPIIGRL